jgi:hypothetical protein
MMYRRPMTWEERAQRRAERQAEREQAEARGMAIMEASFARQRAELRRAREAADSGNDEPSRKPVNQRPGGRVP